MSDSKDVDRLRERLAGLGNFQEMPDPYEEGKRIREEAALQFEEDTINREVRQAALVDEAEKIVLDEQQEDEWGRAQFPFTFEWFANTFLPDQSYIDGWHIDKRRRIVTVTAVGPELPDWYEGQEAVEMYLHGATGINTHPRLKTSELSYEDEWDFDVEEAQFEHRTWEKILWAAFLCAAAIAVIVLLTRSMF